MEPVLSIDDLRVWFPVRVGFIKGMTEKERKNVRAIDGVGFNVARGEVFCLVGESGCGKTTTGKAILRLNEPTAGSILFDMPEDDWNHLQAIRSRLGELAATAVSGEDQAQRDFKTLERARRRLEKLRSPRGARSLGRRVEGLDRSVDILESRMKGLSAGEDPTIRRLVRKGQTKLEVSREYGSQFSPRQARKLERLGKELREAKYRLRRAESTQTRIRKWRRAVRGTERRVERLKRRIGTNDPSEQAKVAALAKELEGRQARLTGLESSHVEAELLETRAKLEKIRGQRNGLMESTRAECEQLEKQIEAIRSHGGPGLEALELRAEQDELTARYDVVAWGKKERQRSHGRLGMRRELKRRMQRLRRKAQIIYQDPYESLNPKMSIFDIVAEPLLANKIVATPSEAEAVVSKALEDVGLKPASEFMLRYPHELSGGQRQRVGIATALVVDPSFIVADEPVSMLDASVRTEILALLLDLKERRNLTYLFITHDLGLAWIIADKVAVMYLGKVVEIGNGPEVIQRPRHPYTKALISVVPSPNPTIEREKIILKGERPNPVDIPAGCRFHPRCPNAVGICGWEAEEVRPELEKLFKEDGAAFPESSAAASVAVTGPFALSVETPDPGQVEAYLRKRIRALALQRPALGSIRKMTPNGGTLDLELHSPTEPQLRQVTSEVQVACHLVEAGMAVAAPEVAPIPPANG